MYNNNNDNMNTIATNNDTIVFFIHGDLTFRYPFSFS